ncbi:MAG: ABC transporter permease [Bacteroidales bacterium]|nr:ABC transporter permease [Bacteroidales bacterium]
MNIIKIWTDELLTVRKDIGILLFVVAMPLFYPLLYVSVYTLETQRDVPIAIVDADNSPTSRQFVRNLDATPEVKVAAHCTSVAEAQQLMEREEVYSVVVISNDFENNLHKGKQSVVGLYCNMCSMIYYKNSMLACSNVSIAMNREIKVENYIHANTEREAQIVQAPIDYKHTPLYNTAQGYGSFLMPPVLMLILQQTLLLGIGMSMGRTRELTGGYALPSSRHYRNAFEIVTGKTLFYLLLYLLWGVYAHIFVTKLFGLPQLGHYSDFILFIVPYLAACTAMGVTLSFLIYHREDCMLLFVFMSLPLLFMSGVSWPANNMPETIKWISYLFPSTFGLNAYVRISSMGASIADVNREMIGIIIQIAVYSVAACGLYYIKLRQKRRRRANGIFGI